MSTSYDEFVWKISKIHSAAKMYIYTIIYTYTTENTQHKCQKTSAAVGRFIPTGNSDSWHFHTTILKSIYTSIKYVCIYDTLYAFSCIFEWNPMWNECSLILLTVWIRITKMNCNWWGKRSEQRHCRREFSGHFPQFSPSTYVCNQFDCTQIGPQL